MKKCPDTPVCPCAVTDLEDADWTRKWIVLELSFLVKKLASSSVCREAVQTVVETILQILSHERAHVYYTLYSILNYGSKYTLPY